MKPLGKFLIPRLKIASTRFYSNYKPRVEETGHFNKEKKSMTKAYGTGAALILAGILAIIVFGQKEPFRNVFDVPPNIIVSKIATMWSETKRYFRDMFQEKK